MSESSRQLSERLKDRPAFLGALSIMSDERSFQWPAGFWSWMATR